MSLENVKAIILILSGKGGVGKSSITTQLALSLSLAGKSVGILDIDLTGPSIPRFLGLEDAKIKQAPGGWLPVEVHPAQILAPLPLQTSGAARTRSQDRLTDGDDLTDSLPPPPPLPPPPAQTTSYSTTTGEIGSLRAISLAFLLPTRASAVIWRGPKKTAMVRQFLTDVLWPPTDYLLIDTPPGTSDEHIALAETLLSATTSIRTTPMLSSGSHSTYQKPYLAGAVIVTTPQAVAVNDVRKEVNFCKKTNIGILGVVENMAGFVCECCGEETNLFGKGGGEVMAQEFGIPFLGRCAMDGAWGRLIEEGKRPVYGDLPNGDAAEGETQQKLATDQKAQHFHDLTEQKTHERDEELLVDKYRSCKLCATFEGLTGQLVNIIEDTPYT